MMSCPLCAHTQAQRISTRDKKYYKCPRCWLIYMDAAFYPNPEEEKERYKEHNNALNNQGYIDFLHKIIDPALLYLKKDMHILDYGSGPNPVLSQLLHRQGFPCDNYDPFFHKVPITQQYDSIFCVETMEHFFDPKKEIEQLVEMITPEGFLFIMTLLWTDIRRFNNWHYRRDFTHVCFYHAHTFDFIAKKYGFIIKYTDEKRVFVMQKNIGKTK